MLVAIIRQNRMVCKLNNLDLKITITPTWMIQLKCQLTLNSNAILGCTSIRIEIWFIQTQKFKFRL